MKDKSDAMESLDKQLKDAGLWEDGLSSEEKQQLLAFIRDSEISAKEEESKRLLGQKPEAPRQVSEKIHEEPQSSLSNTIEDSDPVITFESPSAVKRRKVQGPCDSNGPNKSHESNQIKKRLESSPGDAVDSVIKYASSPLAKGTLKQINSLFSNKSITIQYTATQSPVVVSESEDDNDEYIDNAKDRTAKTSQGKKENNPEMSVSDNQSSNALPDNDENSEALSEKFSLNSSSVQKALFPGNPHQIDSQQNSTSQDENLCSEQLDSQNISETESLDLFLTNKLAKESVSKQIKNSAPNSCKIPVDFFLLKSSSNDVPLKKREIFGEKQSQTFFKAPYETESKCVKRIYSLITDWQVALADYQRKIAKPCKWGPPICIDRQIKVGLLKKNYLNKLASLSQASLISNETSEASSDSEAQLSDPNDQSWISLPKKRRLKTSRAPRNKTSCPAQQKVVKANTEKIEAQQSQTLISSSDATPNESQSVPTPSIPPNPVNPPPPEEVQPEPSTASNPPSRISQPEGGQSNKGIRKTFDLFPDARDFYSSPKVVDSKHPKPPECSSHAPSEAATKTGVGEDITLDSSSSSEETTPQTPQTPCGDGGSFIRSSLKRKNASGPLHTPPFKKRPLTTPSHEAPEEVYVRPSPLRFKSLLSRKANSRQSADTKVKSIPLESSAKSRVGADPPPAGHTAGEGEVSSSSSEQRDRLPQQSEVSSGAGDKTGVQKTLYECPMCQLMFSLYEIEEHAAECNGPVEGVTLRKRQPKSTKPPETEVFYLEEEEDKGAPSHSTK